MSAPIGYSALCLDRQLATAIAFRPRLDQFRSIAAEPGNLSVLQGLQLYSYNGELPLKCRTGYE